MATLAGCSALGGLEKLGGGTASSTPTATPIPTATPESGVARKKPAATPEPTGTPTARPGDLLAQASPTPGATPTPEASDTWTPEPTPVPFPCEAWDGTKPTLRGEIITLPNGAGKGTVHYTACWGKYIGAKPNWGSPITTTHNAEIKDGPRPQFTTDDRGTAGIQAYGMVDDQPYILVRHAPYDSDPTPSFREAMFRRTAVRGNELVYELVKANPLDKEKDMSTVGSGYTLHPTYLGFLRHLPGSPLSIAGDVAGVTFGEGGYDKLALTPNAEARWGTGEVGFACVPLDGELTRQEQTNLALRKTSVGDRYILHVRNTDVYGKTMYREYGLWILAMDGQWFRSKILGPPVLYEAARGGGFGLPVWDRQLNGFVTKMTRATGFIPAHYAADNYTWITDAYTMEELNASFRLVTEDEIEASMEANGCRATD